MEGTSAIGVSATRASEGMLDTLAVGVDGTLELRVGRERAVQIGRFDV